MNKKQILALLIPSSAFASYSQFMAYNEDIYLFYIIYNILFYAFSGVFIAHALQSLQNLSKSNSGKVINAILLLIFLVLVVFTVQNKPQPYSINIYPYLIVWLVPIVVYLILSFIDFFKKINALNYIFLSLIAYATISIIQLGTYKIFDPSYYSYKGLQHLDSSFNGLLPLQNLIYQGSVFATLSILVYFLINKLPFHKLTSFSQKINRCISNYRIIINRPISFVVFLLVLVLFELPLFFNGFSEYESAEHLLPFISIFVFLFMAIFVWGTYSLFISIVKFNFHSLLFLKIYFSLTLLFEMILLFLIQNNVYFKNAIDISIQNKPFFLYLYLILSSFVMKIFRLILLTSNIIELFAIIAIIIISLIQNLFVAKDVLYKEKKLCPNWVFLQVIFFIALLVVDIYLVNRFL